MYGLIIMNTFRERIYNNNKFTLNNRVSKSVQKGM